MQRNTFIVLWLFVLLPVFGLNIGSLVSLDTGLILGNPRTASGVLEFLGIPYAAPPVKSLRWKPPQPVRKWNETILAATSYGPSCYSARMGDLTEPQSEDCLSINVWTKAQETCEKAPVMVWLYGGGFEFGWSNSTVYNGTNLALDGVVVVTFNYRVGVLGFLGLTELDDEQPNSGNYGLQDQFAALRWVQENISRFGGDPENVTIFGESAGAHAVGLLMASGLSSGLFHKAIMQSGSFWSSEHGSLSTFQEARTRGSRYREKLGAAGLAQLRALPAEEVNGAALWDDRTDPSLTAFSPSIDGYVLTDSPEVIFAKGGELDIPLLAGFNDHEEIPLFAGRALPHNTSQQYVDAMRVFFGEHADQALLLYPGKTNDQATVSSLELIGDVVIGQPMFEAIDHHATHSRHKSFGYHFTYTSPYSPIAAHLAEIAYVFGNLGPNPFIPSPALSSPADYKVAKAVMSYWTNFAKTGNPNGPRLTYWPPYDRAAGKIFLEIGNETSAKVCPSLERFEFIRSVRENFVFPPRWRDLAFT
ncbi:hypothetical protein NM208_g5723 [Fusarium decemcellulare]|uniref:Uncharacterized protein n=1 Tax=Fusarium decemcellulare TaxID=57161 RepID=A0ACC1SFY6_9HYPO|nr:hypothetical protein NM208_g5723 [Fusarium decemcellulare]